jgi:hypothetical protein
MSCVEWKKGIDIKDLINENNDDEYFSNLVESVFSEISKNTITFYDIKTELDRRYDDCEKSYINQVYNCFSDSTKDRDKIEAYYNSLKENIEKQRSRLASIWNKHKKISNIAWSNSGIIYNNSLTDEDIRYIYYGFVE